MSQSVTLATTPKGLLQKSVRLEREKDERCHMRERRGNREMRREFKEEVDKKKQCINCIHFKEMNVQTAVGVEKLYFNYLR